MTDLKYEYLFNSDGKLTHHSEAIRLNEYSLYPGESLDYIYKEGNERQYFALKKVSNNPFEEITLKKVGGESIEHYNAKMKIAYEKKYFDTIFNQWIEFDFIVAEKQQEGNKIPDLSCYDSNGNLILCVEIYFTNSKSLEDIEKLKNIKVPIVEININYDNRCKHIVLTEVLESNRQKLADINFKLQEFEQEQQGLETEYNRLADELQKGLSGITTDIKYFEINFKTRIYKIDNWLQERLSKIEGEPNSFDKIKTAEREIKKIEANGEKTDYRIGKLESEINRIEIDIKQRKTSFREIASKSKIEWFRNSWMTNKSFDLINEIKYWLS